MKYQLSNYTYVLYKPKSDKASNKIVTDRLNIYPNLITPINHDTRKYRNNRIERCNLTLRQHIKRLSRKTICYSKSNLMLEATFKLYLFWNNWSVKEF